VVGFPDVYAYRVYSKQRCNPSEHTSTLANDRSINWAEQLFSKNRVKRALLPDPERGLYRVKRVENTTTDYVRQRCRQPLFNDELWSYEWYLQDTRTDRMLPRLDLNVLPVYAMGFNGQGVRVSILDDGIEHNHTDLRDNYDAEISWDSNDRDSDPYPRPDQMRSNSHGTRCAGEVM
ncbi:unnamed protein product, partial [Leptidea sinapis]